MSQEEEEMKLAKPLLKEFNAQQIGVSDQIQMLRDLIRPLKVMEDRSDELSKARDSQEGIMNRRYEPSGELRGVRTFQDRCHYDERRNRCGRGYGQRGIGAYRRGSLNIRKGQIRTLGVEIRRMVKITIENV